MISTTDETTGVRLTIAPIEEWEAVIERGQRPTLRARDHDLTGWMRSWFQGVRVW